MIARTTLAALMTAVALAALPGCAVTRGQETVGAYVDDTAITTAVKAKFVENKEVDASAISVETLKGTVMLSGFAKNSNEKAMAESIARGVKGVVAVRNSIEVRG
jgi:osmotically-inducible protein OsmY